MGGGAAAGTEKRNPVALQLLESVGSDDVYYQGRAGDNYTSARKGRHTVSQPVRSQYWRRSHVLYSRSTPNNANLMKI